MNTYVDPYTENEKKLLASNTKWIEKNLRLQTLLKRAVKENNILRRSLEASQSLARGYEKFDTGRSIVTWGGSYQLRDDNTFTATSYGKVVPREDYLKLMEEYK
jgi:hypothetical protein